MNKDTKARKKWVVNRLKRKYKIPAKHTEAVLGAIADLTWDWSHSRYDLPGLQIEELLEEIGNTRNPRLDEF